MATNVSSIGAAPAQGLKPKAAVSILAAMSFCHFLNDTLQSLIPAIYPLLKNSFHLDFGQIGLITLTNQLTASLLQPLVGSYTDKNPLPYSLAAGMTFTLMGLLSLSIAPSYVTVLASVALVGIGSSIFHPEASRTARLASGGQHGLAQSVFQVGGNAGTAVGPLLAAFIVLPRGQHSVAWFSAAALLGIFLLTNVGTWLRNNRPAKAKGPAAKAFHHSVLSPKQVKLSLVILLALLFSKYFYLASLQSYFTFYLINKFHLPVQNAQVHLFMFLGAVAVGTILGGPIGDRIGAKYVIWGSILGVLPFTMLLPYANLFWTGVLTVIIGLILASAFPAILVYAQELVPGKVGTISGLFFGFAFGMGAIGAALLGQLADATSIGFVYRVCAFLPAIGILAALLPNLEKTRLEPAK